MLIYVKKMMVILLLSGMGIGAQVLIKKGLDKVGGFTLKETLSYVFPILTNMYILSALAILMLASFVYFSLLSKMELSALYPIVVGVNFTLLVVMSTVVLNETLPIAKIIGLLLIMAGVIVLFLARVKA